MIPHRSPVAQPGPRSLPVPRPARTLARAAVALLLTLGGVLLVAAPAPAGAATRSAEPVVVSIVHPCPLTDAGAGARFPCAPCPFGGGDIRFPCDPFPCFPFPRYTSGTDLVAVTYPCPDF
jgi:hypothetical protein